MKIIIVPQIYQSSKPLRIGYLDHDGYQQPTPSMTRAVQEVKALLEQAGHTVRSHYSLTHILHSHVVHMKICDMNYDFTSYPLSFVAVAGAL